MLRSDSKRERVEKERYTQEAEELIKKQNEELQQYIQRVEELEQQN
jgi:hypothetical protein